MSGQFKDSDLCAACGHPRHRHDLTITDKTTKPPTVATGICRGCPCQRFIPRPAGDEKREGEG